MTNRLFLMNIVFGITAAYTVMANADNLTGEDLTRRIIDIQKMEPSVNKNSREGETAYAEWETKKNNLLKQLNNNQMSGTCVYRGGKKNIGKTIECLTGDIRKQMENKQIYTLCFMNAMDMHYGANTTAAVCGKEAIGELFVLKPNTITSQRINTLYDDDKIKFSGIIEKCKIYFAENPKQRSDANYKCELNNVTAEIVK